MTLQQLVMGLFDTIISVIYSTEEELLLKIMGYYH